MNTIPRLAEVVCNALAPMGKKRLDDDTLEEIERVADEAVDRYRSEYGFDFAPRWTAKTKLVGVRLDVVFVNERGFERSFEEYERELWKAAGVEFPFD